MLVRREHGHIGTDFRKHGDGRHGILVESGNGADECQDIGERFDDTENCLDDFILVLFQFVDMVEALTKFHGLFRRNSTIDSSLDLLDGSLATTIDERGNVEFFSWMFEHVAGNGHRRFPEDIAEHVIQLEVGNGKAVLRTVLFASLHIRELPQVTDEVA